MVTLGCADPCHDDGLLQESCNQPGAGSGSTGGGQGNDDASSQPSGGQIDSEGVDGSGDANTAGEDGASDGTTAGSSSMTTASATGDGVTTGIDAGGPWCLDADGDGFGDPTQCSDEPSEGTVENDGDCNDGDADTFPGAAEHEPDATTCTTDADGDGWGDATPAPGATAGADCWDSEIALGPSTVELGTIDNGPLDDVVATVNPLNGMLSVIAPIDTPLLGWSTTAVALRNTGDVFAIEQVSNRLHRIDYQGVCDGTSDAGEATMFGPDYGNAAICGLSFDDTDRLWAIDAQADAVLELDPTSGSTLSIMPLAFQGGPLQLVDCDLTWDCHERRLLLAHSATGQVLALDPTNGELTLVAEYDPDLGSSGIAYEPKQRVVYVSSGIQLNLVPLDGTPATEIGNFSYDGTTVADLANLSPLYICP